MAKRLKKLCPHNIEYGDLVAVGMIGLLQAIERYSPEFDNKFKTYAELRVLGAMKDELRSSDHLKRRARKMVNAIEESYFKCGPHSEARSRAASMDIDIEYYRKYSQLLGTHFISVDDHEAFTAKDKNALMSLIQAASEGSPLDSAIINEQREILWEVLSTLKERDRSLVLDCFVRGLNQAAVAEKFGLSASRVSQLLQKILLRMRKHLSTKGISPSDIHTTK